MRILSHLSFSTRLVIVAFVAAVGPIAIAYVAMLDLPEKVAADSLELRLREESQEVVNEIRNQRLTLRDAMISTADDPEFQRAVLDRDRRVIRRILIDVGAGLPDTIADLDFRFARPQAVPGELGAITAPITIAQGNRRGYIVVFHAIDDDTLAELRSNRVAGLALTLEGHIVARAGDVPPEGALPTDAPDDGGLEPTFAEFQHSGNRLHVYDRSVGLDGRLRMAAISTPGLERSAIDEPRRDVARSVVLLALSTAIFAIAGAMGVNRSIRRFAERTSDLARGNYAVRLPVRGNDTFARLASSFNQLAAEVERKVTQLEQAATRFEQTLQTIEEGICVWDTDGEVRFWNNGARQMTGVAAEDVVDGGELHDFLRDQLTTGTRRLQLPARRAGAALVVDLVVTRMPGGGILQTFRDITTLEMLHQTRRNFMATAAHELRTPLTTILGFSQTLANPKIDLSDAQRAEFLGLIHEQAQHLQRLTDAFFTNHQLANERVEVSIESVQLSAAVERGLHRAIADLERAGETPPTPTVKVDPKLHVRGDARALAGVLAVLIDNAAKYGTEPIDIEAERVGDSVVLRVHDGGGDIAEHHLDRLFDPFYRIDVDMRSGVGGAGLGLFTARKLIAAMKGVIRVDSSPEAGTTFSIELAHAPTPPDAAPGRRGDERPGRRMDTGRTG